MLVLKIYTNDDSLSFYNFLKFVKITKKIIFHKNIRETLYIYSSLVIEVRNEILFFIFSPLKEKYVLLY